MDKFTKKFKNFTSKFDEIDEALDQVNIDMV